jgi:hypothetical protein
VPPEASSTNTKALPQRLPRWVSRTAKTPIAACKVWLLFLTNYRRLFTESLAGSFPFRVRPLAFFSICFGLWASALSLGQREIGWYEVHEALPAYGLLFAVDFMDLGLNIDTLSEKTARDEYLQPGSSKASAEIRKQIGSDSADAVGAYLRAKDPEFGIKFEETAAIVAKHDRVLQWCQRSILVMAGYLALLVVIPIHFVLRARGRTVKDTLYVALYVYGFWLPVLAANETASHFIFSSGYPSNPWVVGSISAVLCIILVLVPVTWWRTFRFTHKASSARLVGSLFAVACAFLLVAFLASEAMLWLKIQMPEWNESRRY